ncbi:MAG: ATP-binding protein [Chlamydiae bacterium]|nr:ATP-binding protein [Chlamydiota bacterium]MBI3267119.1 ATP-binding protein [Chlamydiota bacterium]
MKNYQRLFYPPKSSFFLLGVRGVGKSTLIKHVFKNAKIINLLDEALYQLYLSKPQSFVEDLSLVKPGDWVVVDEVQRLPQLLNEVHRFIEEKKIKFALLGSSARKLRRAGVNLLGGRALQKWMHPFLLEELGDDFSLDKVFRNGSIPLIWTSVNPKEQLLAYMQLYLKEEIQAEAIVRNLPGFARFLPVAALFHSQVINVEGLGRDCGVARSTVEGYLQILEDTLIAFQVPAYENKLRVRQRAHPKLYWCDSGIVRAAKRQLEGLAIEEKGALFEGFIAQTLKAYRELGRLDCDQISYWSAGKNSVEVDFVIERGRELIGIEAKSGTDPEKKWFAGLSALEDSVKLKRSILVYTGKRKYKHDSGVEVLPLQDFMKEVERF